MRARVVGAGAKSEADGDVLFVAPDRVTAAKLRAKTPRAPVVVAVERLPFRDGSLDEVVDERPVRPAGIEEDARVVRAGGRVALVTEGPAGGGFAARLGGLWKKQRDPVAPTDASAWLLGAGCTELAQRTRKDGAVVTEGRVPADGP